MRPGQLRPGNLCLRRQDSGLSASMRPGQLRPGNWRRPPVDRRSSDAGASMRPGQLRPGNLERYAGFGSQSDEYAASMRPGQLRPGNMFRPGSTAGRPAAASMRPGQLRPGNPGCPVGQDMDRDHRRFNEAGAASPRKYVNSEGPVSARPERFNEAGAASPRKSGGDTQQHCPQAVGSTLQ